MDGSKIKNGGEEDNKVALFKYFYIGETLLDGPYLKMVSAA